MRLWNAIPKAKQQQQQLESVLTPGPRLARAVSVDINHDRVGDQAEADGNVDDGVHLSSVHGTDADSSSRRFNRGKCADRGMSDQEVEPSGLSMTRGGRRLHVGLFMEASGALRRRVHRAQLNTRRWGAWRETTTAPRRSAVIVASRPMRMPEAVGVGWGWLGQESSAAPACESAVHQVWMIVTMTSMLCQKHSARLSCEGAGSRSGTPTSALFIHPKKKKVF